MAFFVCERPLAVSKLDAKECFMRALLVLFIFLVGCNDDDKKSGKVLSFSDGVFQTDCIPTSNFPNQQFSVTYGKIGVQRTGDDAVIEFQVYDNDTCAVSPQTQTSSEAFKIKFSEKDILNGVTYASLESASGKLYMPFFIEGESLIVAHQFFLERLDNIEQAIQGFIASPKSSGFVLKPVLN